MFKKLVEVAERFRHEGNLPPTGYKPKWPKWIVNLDGDQFHLEGPYVRKQLRAFHAPDRQRSGTPSADNLKPYLLLDDARYALGIAEPGKEKEAQLLHRGFMELLRKAGKATDLPEFTDILDFLACKNLEAIRSRVEPKDLVTFRVVGKDLIEDLKVQKFWAQYLAEELVGQEEVQCGVCERTMPVVRILPREIVVLGQKCQVTSFNQDSFGSYGKVQTGNSPMCFECASSAIDVLDYLIRTEKHCRTLFFDPDASSLENQLAVYWLDRKIDKQATVGVLDLETLIGSILNDSHQAADAPPARLSQLQALLASPWKANQTVANLDETCFYLAVLSANKGRLVIREWLEASLGQIRTNLAKFLESTPIVSSWGDPARPLSIGTLLKALDTANPNISRGLLRTAYLGVKPPNGLWAAAVNSFRNPNTLQDPKEAWRLQALAGALKLGLFFGREETMSELNRDYRSRAYLCGRLLAVLEEAQQRASHFSLNKTLVDRFYGAASTAPAATFGGLVRLATTAHLPKVVKEVNLLMEEVMSGLDEAGGFPKTLTLAEQGEFALGFYHQRANFRARSGKSKAQAPVGGDS